LVRKKVFTRQKTSLIADFLYTICYILASTVIVLQVEEHALIAMY
jgi:hypothetical protein